VYSLWLQENLKALTNEKTADSGIIRQVSFQIILDVIFIHIYASLIV
jgi:hypothetical protein